MSRTIHTYGDSHATFYGAWADGVVDGVTIAGVILINIQLIGRVQ